MQIPLVLILAVGDLGTRSKTLNLFPLIEIEDGGPHSKRGKTGFERCNEIVATMVKSIQCICTYLFYLGLSTAR